MMPRFPDPHARLGGALTNLSGGVLLESRQTPWASATFPGARHSFVFHVPKDAGGGPLTEIEEREFDLPGHLLADIGICDWEANADGDRCTIEALTVENA
jgi:hypothetical protein